MADPIVVRPDRARIRVEPGGHASTNIAFHNASDAVGHYRLTLTGTPAGWAKLNPEQVSLFGSEDKHVELRLEPPPDAQPAIHPLTLHATSQTRPIVEVITLVEVEVPAPAQPATPAPGPSEPVVAPQRSQRDDDIEVRAEPLDGAGLPPTAGRWRVQVRNAGRILTTFGFGVAGVRTAWLSADPPQVPLMPKESQEAVLTVCLSDETPVGPQSLILRTYSHLNLQKRTEIRLRLEVRPPDDGAGDGGAPGGVSGGSDVLTLATTEQGAVQAAPGAESRLGLILQNTSGSPLPVRLSCLGVPDAWARPDPPTPTVQAQTTARAALILTPPRETPIGSYPLAIRAEVPQHRNIVSQLDLTLTVATEVGEVRSRPPIRLALASPSLSVAPGSDVEGTVTIENLSTLMLTVELAVDGVDPDWVEVVRPQLTVFPQRPDTCRLVVRPPADPARSIAGVYTLHLRGSSREYPDQKDEAALGLEIQRVGEYEAALEEGEARGVWQATYPLRVRNQANAPAQVRFTFSDRENALDYKFDPLELPVPVAGEATATLTVRARQPATAERKLPFQVGIEGEFAIKGRPAEAGPIYERSGLFVQLERPRLLVSISPKRADGTPNGAYEVSVVNPGDDEVEVQLSAGDAAGALEYQFQSAGATLAPHAEHTTQLQVSARRHPRRGQQTRSFKVTATPEGDDVLVGSDEATLVLRGALPPLRLGRWAVGAILLGLLLAAVALLFPTIEPWLRRALPPVPSITLPRIPTAQTPTPLLPTPAPATPVPPTPAPSAPAPAATAPLPAPTVAPPTTLPTPTPTELPAARALRALPGKASAVYQSLGGPERTDVDATAEVPSASTIKLAIMVEAFRAAGEGKLPLDRRHTVTANKVVGGTGILQRQVGRSLTTLELLEVTLTNSDNTGGNMLIDLLGMEQINSTMRQLGYTRTRLARRFLDEEARKKGLENVTSAADMADMLRRIHGGTLVDKSASEQMLRILRLRGQRADPGLDFIGRNLTPRPTLAQINGVLPGIRNDIGIVETGGKPYVLAIFLRDQADEAAAEQAIARASAEIFAAAR
jgi:beta-lactamase class A